MTDKIVENHQIPIRLDRYIRNLSPDFTQGFIEKSLRKGLIKVNGQKAKSNTRISNNDKISLPDSILNVPDKENDPKTKAFAKKLVDKYLIFENEHLCAFNKPAGLASQGGSKVGLSLDDAFKILDLRLVHRLDKDTSGIILAAKTRDDAILLTKAFEERKIYKTYLALLSSNPKKKQGIIKSYIGKKDMYLMESFDKEMDGTKEAISKYVVRPSDNHNFLVEFSPLTGRMHQLRLHAMKIASPIIGDRKYNGARAEFLMLHAIKLIIDKSVYGEEIEIESDLPDYFSL